MCCLIHPGCTRLWRKTPLPQKRTSVTLRSCLFNTKPSAVAEVTFLLSWFFSWHKISTSSCFFQDSWFTFIQGTSLLFVWKFSVPLKLVVSFKAFLYDIEKSKCVGARSYPRTEYMELLQRKQGYRLADRVLVECCPLNKLSCCLQVQKALLVSARGTLCTGSQGEDLSQTPQQQEFPQGKPDRTNLGYGDYSKTPPNTMGV